MNKLLALQTESIQTQELEDLIQYAIIVNGKRDTSITPHDIQTRFISGSIVLCYIDRCLHLYTYEEFGLLGKEYSIVVARDRYEFFSGLVS